MSEEFARERHQMVERQIRARGVSDPRLLTAMRDLPRHLFVPESLRPAAYGDHPLPIGSGQTISQPYIVAVMTELLDLEPGDRVLEIGTGSGYQAAILGRMAHEVWSIERLPEIADLARQNLARVGVENVHVVAANGTLGLHEHAPFDAIIITAGTPSVPRPLFDQLADGGRLVAPVGGRELQFLVVYTRRGDEIIHRSWGAVCFVPLIGRHGWEEHRRVV
ncbi:protein-L-isoaspartate(D-aspartate) O-methyltransferase [Methanofollis sp. W23]|uniref:protein-L-isoaspartate(D-aspartate) O-methyltransferase n=1 Tax=Methanofollis sp. W23 TaxID=2817849 RepID=UPI001AEA7231|nr:protein-L-isoaspartate(D-aspartate) O-methyltransferase [Methanofollis sp. W23]MBP2146845.1 protein-L-isoaspartate(D-aspartate) O-methyltransferase [Methanofollis sp. W23]